MKGIVCYTQYTNQGDNAVPLVSLKFFPKLSSCPQAVNNGCRVSDMSRSLSVVERQNDSNRKNTAPPSLVRLLPPKGTSLVSAVDPRHEVISPWQWRNVP